MIAIMCRLSREQYIIDNKNDTKIPWKEITCSVWNVDQQI